MARRIGKYKMSDKEAFLYDSDVNQSSPATLTVAGAATVGSTLAVDGNCTIGDAVGDAHTINGALTITSKTANAVGGGFDGAQTATVSVAEINGERITTILVDLTGLLASGTIKDVIGEDGVAAAYLTQLTSAVNGVPYRVSIACTELPAGSNCPTDIDLVSNSAALAEDAEYDGSGAAIALVAPGAAWTQGAYRETAAALDLTNLVDDYLYLANGDGSHSGGTFTGGKFIIKVYGAVVGS